jgi:hypothetical protein
VIEAALKGVVGREIGRLVPRGLRALDACELHAKRAVGHAAFLFDPHKTDLFHAGPETGELRRRSLLCGAVRRVAVRADARIAGPV